MRAIERKTALLLLLLAGAAAEARAAGLLPLRPIRGGQAAKERIAPRRRPFPGVIGDGALPLPLPGSGRSYEDLLEGKAGAEKTVFRVALFRVGFEADSAGALTTGDGRFDVSEDDGSWVVDAPPHDSTYFHTHLEVLDRYYRAQSYGKLDIDWEIFPKSEEGGEYRLANTADYLPEGNSDEWDLDARVDGLIRLCADAIALVDTVDPTVDFSAYDGYMVVHPGPDLQTDINGDSPGDIPSFFLAFGDEDTLYVDRDAGDELLVPGVTMIPEYTSQDGFVFGLNGVLAHEFGHQIGLPDLYDTERSWPAIGVWGLMDSGGMVSIDAGDVYLGSTIPASLSAWSKLYLGWADAEIATSDRDLAIACATHPAPPAGSARYGVIPVNETEYFVVENRFGLAAEGDFAAKIDERNRVILGPITNDSAEAFTFDYDYALPGWGLLVWHVNERVMTDERIIYTNDVNVDYNDRGLELEEADGIKDLGNPYSAYWDGSPYDPFFEGSAERFGPETAPNSDLSDGGKSKVTLSGIGPPGRVIDLRLEVNRNVDGFPLPLREDSSFVYLAGLALDRSGRGAAAAVWVAVDSTDTLYGVTTVASAGESLEVRRAALPGPPAGLPVAGDLSGTGRDEIVQIAGGRLVRIDPASAATVHDLGAVSPETLFAGPLLLDTDGDGRQELVVIEGESLAVYDVGADSIEAVERVYAGETPSSNLAAAGGGGAGPVVYYVAGGYLNVFDFGSGKRARLARAAVSEKGEEDALHLLVGDLDGGGEEKIVLFSSQGTGQVFAPTGELVSGWPVLLDGGLTGDPFLCDRNGDGFLEIALPSGQQLVLLEKNGVRATETPFEVPPYMRKGSGFIGNGVAVAGAGGSVFPVVADDWGRLWRWSEADAPAAGWPISTGTVGGAIAAGPSPRDEGADALYALSWDGFLYAYPFPESAGFLWSSAGGGGTRRYAPADSVAARPEEPGAGPSRLTAAYCYPNPVRGAETSLRYALSLPARVTIDVRDAAGGPVRSVGEAPGERGPNEVSLDTGALASGVYYVRIEADGEVRFVKMAVTR